MISASLFSIFLLILTLFLLVKSRAQLEIKTSWLIGGLGVKLLAAAFLWWLYTDYYSDRSSADIYKYFDDAVAIESACKKLEVDQLDFFNQWLKPNAAHLEALSQTQHWDLKKVYFINDNRSIIRIHLLLLPLSQGQFWVHQLFFTLLGFWGTILLFYFLKTHFGEKKNWLYILMLLFPSLLLWTSGALKESYLFFAMGGFLTSAQGSFVRPNFKHIGSLLFFTLLLLTIKVYVAIVLIPLTFSTLTLKKVRYKDFGFNSFLEVISVGLISTLISGQYIIDILQDKLKNFTDLAMDHNASSYFNIPIYESLIDFILYTPFALYNVFLRPVFPSTLNVLTLLSVAENLVLLLLLVLAVLNKKAVNRNQKQWAWYYAALIFPVALLIGSTVPILGALVRYKVVILPFYLALLLTFVDLGKLPTFKKLK